MNLLVLHTVVYECICNVSTVYTGLSTRPLSRLKFERNDIKWQKAIVLFLTLPLYRSSNYIGTYAEKSLF